MGSRFNECGIGTPRELYIGHYPEVLSLRDNGCFLVRGRIYALLPLDSPNRLDQMGLAPHRCLSVPRPQLLAGGAAAFFCESSLLRTNHSTLQSFLSK